MYEFIDITLRRAHLALHDRDKSYNVVDKLNSVGCQINAPSTAMSVFG